MQNNKGQNIIVELSLQFAVNAISYTELLEYQKRYTIARQLLRSATSIGANIREAQNSESKGDFIHKMKIAAKETDETEYWLVLCSKLKGYPPTEELLRQCLDISKVLSKIISTSKKFST